MSLGMTDVLTLVGRLDDAPHLPTDERDERREQCHAPPGARPVPRSRIGPCRRAVAPLLRAAPFSLSQNP